MSPDPHIESLETKPKYSEALKLDIGLYRRAAARVAVIDNSNLGSDLMMFGVCYDLMSDEYVRSGLNIEARNTFAETSKGDIGGSDAQKRIDDYFGKLDRSWISGSKLDSFKGFQKLTAKSKKELCTYCAAASLMTFSTTDEEVEFDRYLFESGKTNPAEYFRPSAQNFFKRVPEPHFSAMATEILGESYMTENKALSRPKVSEELERAVNKEPLGDNPNDSDFLLNWLPEGF
jgi:ParB family chromosome partitioning protein